MNYCSKPLLLARTNIGSCVTVRKIYTVLKFSAKLLKFWLLVVGGGCMCKKLANKEYYLLEL